MRSLKAFAFAYYVVIGISVLWLSSCGGNGSLSGGGNPPPPPPTVASVTVTGVPATLQVPQTAQVACAVTMSDGTTTSACTFAVSNPAVASINATTGVLTAVAPGTATVTATSTKDPTKSSTPSMVTVTPAVIPVSITSVIATANSTAITMAQTAIITAAVQGTGAFSSAITWTATNNGTVSGTGNPVTFTPTAVGTATITACSSATGFTTICGTATVTVTRATPILTSVAINNAKDSWIFCPISCSGSILGFTIYGSGLQAGDQINMLGYWPTITLTAANIASDGTAVIGGTTFGGMNVDANQQPNFIYFTVVPQDGTPQSNTVAYAYLDGYNSASHGPNGELLNQYWGEAYVWQNAGGSLTNTLNFVDGGLNVVYETDGTNAYFVNGDYFALDGTLLSGPSSDGWYVSGTSAENGTVILTEPNANEIALYKPVPNPSGPQLTNRVPVGVMPYTSVMTTLNGNTFGFVASVDGTPTLWKIDTNGTTVGSAPLTGFTSLSDIDASNRYLTGGWPMAVFHSGTAAGKVAVVSTHDKSLLLYDGGDNALPLLQTVMLPCEIPWAVDAVDSTGKLVVACIKVAGFTDSGTTFLSIDVATGDVTTLASVSIKAPNGFPLGFLADADNLYVFSALGAPDVQPNK